MDRGMADRLLASCIPGGMEAAAAEREADEGLELSLSLHPSTPTSPPRFQAVFACCYCPRKFRSSQALGGHQNAHKLQRNLARRGREAASAPPAPPTPVPAGQQGSGSSRAPGGGSVSAPTPPRSRAEPPPPADAWGEGRHQHHRRHHQQQHLLYHQLQRPAAPAAAGAEGSSGGGASRGGGGGQDPEEIIDLSLKL